MNSMVIQQHNRQTIQVEVNLYCSFNMRKVKVLSLPERIKEKSTFRAKALRRELIVTILRNVDFSVIVSGSSRNFTFRIPLNVLPTCTGNVNSSFDNTALV